MSISIILRHIDPVGHGANNVGAILFRGVFERHRSLSDEESLVFVRLSLFMSAGLEVAFDTTRCRRPRSSGSSMMWSARLVECVEEDGLAGTQLVVDVGDASARPPHQKPGCRRQLPF